MLHLRALGSPSLVDHEGRVVEDAVAQTKRLVLLTYVAIGDPAGCRRDTLLAAFWPDLDEAHARNALRQALSMLRRLLGEAVLPADRAETIRVSPQALTCDVLQFERALADGEPASALALYRGDFLNGLHVSGMEEIERWIEDRRVNLRRRAVRAALLLADQADAEGHGTGPATWAQRAITLAPHEETAWRRLIQVHVRQGNVSAALETYERLCRMMDNVFQSAPSPETRAIVEPLRRAIT